MARSWRAGGGVQNNRHVYMGVKVTGMNEGVFYVLHLVMMLQLAVRLAPCCSKSLLLHLSCCPSNLATCIQRPMRMRLRHKLTRWQTQEQYNTIQ